MTNISIIAVVHFNELNFQRPRGNPKMVGLHGKTMLYFHLTFYISIKARNSLTFLIKVMIKKEVVFNHCYFIKSCFCEMSLNVTVEEPVQL